MRIRHPNRYNRLLLSALSIALLTMLGAAGESLGYDRWLKANTVETRTHSFPVAASLALLYLCVLNSFASV